MLVEVAGAGLDGNNVEVGISVEAGCVMDGVNIDNVGVWVAALEGKLHASMAETRASTNKKLRDFIAVLLYFDSILPNEHANGNRLFGVLYLIFFLSLVPSKVFDSSNESIYRRTKQERHQNKYEK